MSRSTIRNIGLLTISFFIVSPALGDVVILTPTKDNTLFEIIDGSLSNGAGAFIFAGATNTSLRRRAVLAFDVVGNVPSGATINSATLTLNLSLTPPASSPQTHALHRLLADWGEGTSDAGVPGGEGAPSTANDATWIHRFFSSALWASAGGDFEAAPSASTTVNGVGSYNWTSAQLAADAQGWLDIPSTNKGWIVLGDESAAGEARRYDSREHATEANRPQLTIDFTPVPIPAVSTWGIVALTLLLLSAGTFALRRTRSSVA